jgi:hypothetical protein
MEPTKFGDVVFARHFVKKAQLLWTRNIRYFYADRIAI